MYQINCGSLEQMVEVCALLVREGICFEADANNFLVKCSGGF